MNRVIKVAFFVFAAFFFQNILAQNRLQDSVLITPADTSAALQDTVIASTGKIKFKVKVNSVQSDSTAVKHREPNRIVWMGAIAPGLGQILNHKYWKLPIVYGGFLTCAYAITWYGSRYTQYKNAYLAISDGNPKNDYLYLEILPTGTTVQDFGGEANFKNVLNTAQNSFRRYRDLSILISVGYYALTVLDAYVDAQLFDFDITPDLSMHISPNINTGSINSAGIRQTSNYGVLFSFNIK